ncbi:hypothetical protein [Romboutsia sp. Marseille-P6047]|uniref:hypothetical protein n=1 Tax=Romboutsia sp. Marseille-P6047 TaxID=2161817 RepID=UPI000F0477F9|nr:hypothetical protein [Romboutsia sp. Marseille-P6047]
MINKNVFTIIVTTIMIAMITGCTNTSMSSSTYSDDYNKVSEISTTSLAISDAYDNSGSKSEFKKEAKKIIKDLEKTKMKTKEGKEVLNAYVEISECLVDTIVDNWNKGVLQVTGDKKLIQLEAKLKEKIYKFDEKIEELKVESGFYEMLEELK